MKQVILVRHAKADEKKKSARDIHRRLQNKGRYQAKEMAIKLVRRIKKPHLFISSPANRALETAQIFALHWQHPVNTIEIVDSLYQTPDEGVYLNVLKNLPESLSSAVLFGHDPAISGVAINLSREFSERLPTSGILVLRFDVAKWSDIKPQSGQITYYNFPKEKKHKIRQSDNHLYHDIYHKLSEALANIEESEFLNKDKFIKKWSFQITSNIAKIMQKNKSTLH